MNQPQTPLPFPIRYEVVRDGPWFTVVRRPGNREVIGTNDELFAQRYAREKNLEQPQGAK